MVHLLYKTTNLVNGKFYYGVHSCRCPKPCKYLGSGDNILSAIKKYGRHNFSRATIGEFITRNQAYAAEKSLLTAELISDPMCYNIDAGGRGCLVGVLRTQQHKDNISKALKGRDITWGSKISQSAHARVDNKTPIVYQGVCYRSLRAASRATGLHRDTLSKLAREGTPV